jgi:hypothetical protein
MADSLQDMFTKINADGTTQPIVPHLTPFEAAASADVPIPFGAKTIVPGTTVSLSPAGSALSAFVLVAGAANFDNSGGNANSVAVCELQLNGVARPEFMQTNLGIGGLNLMAAESWALLLAPGSAHTLRLAVWKSANVGVFQALHPHTKLSGILVEIFTA